MGRLHIGDQSVSRMVQLRSEIQNQNWKLQISLLIKEISIYKATKRTTSRIAKTVEESKYSRYKTIENNS